MRLVVVGCSGSGKTTMARALARALNVPHVELDGLNWDPGWRNLTAEDPETFRRRIAAAAAGDAWVMDGNYVAVEGDHWARATAFVWMDTPRWRVMPQVIWRSVSRAVAGRELWAGTGNRERPRDWLKKEHPIRWAWDTWAMIHDRYADWFADDVFEGRPVWRVRSPREGRALVRRLATERSDPAYPG